MAQNYKLLIVEDEKPVAKAMQLKFSNEGMDVTVASNGQEGVDHMKENKYDLVILDLVMPEKNGFEVLEAMQEEGLKFPVIVASNLSQDEDLERAKQLGAVDYFVKADTPISDLVTKVTGILEGGGEPAAKPESETEAKEGEE